MLATIISSFFSCPELVDGPAVVLFGGPYAVLDGTRLEVPEGSKRLLVFTALNPRRVDRRHVAGCLWPAGSDQRAGGNLRSALWRLKCAGIDLIESDNCSLKLRPGTVVDVHVVAGWAARLIDGSAPQSDLRSVYWPADAAELLPGWYDDWIIFEALSRSLTKAGRCAEAVDAAISAVGIDPLRESASRVLIEAHLAEGNWVEARRTYERYRDTVRCELGVEPSEQLTDLVRAMYATPRPRSLEPASR